MHTQKRIELPQGPIHYRDVGSGPPLVFVHGLLVDGALWEPVVERLSATHRCIVPDWPLGSHREAMREDADLSPHGMAKLISDFIGAIGLEHVTLVGNDSGGALSQMVAARHPERVSALVLTTCDAFEVFPPAAFKYLLLAARVPGVMWMLGLTLRLVPPLQRLPLAYGALTKKRLPAELLSRWAAPSADAGVRRDVGKFMRGIRASELVAAAEALRGFNKPVLLAWTPEDRFFPVSLAHRLKEVMPHARLELIEDAKVFVALDQPERLAWVIEGFTATKGAAAA